MDSGTLPLVAGGGLADTVRVMSYHLCLRRPRKPRSPRSRAALAPLRALVLPLLGLLSAGALAASADERNLLAFSDPKALWGSGVEAVIEEAYRECFRTYILGGRVMTLRMPFGQNNERSELAETELQIEGGGKANPAELWAQIDAVLATRDFADYAAALSEGKEKVLAFDLVARNWSASRDLFRVARMKAGAYPGLPHKPYVLVSGEGLEARDVYNYLYSVGRIGMDCSGFVWHVLSTVAKRGGVDLGKSLRKSLRAPRAADASLYVGTWFFDPRNKELVEVKDEIRNLKPGDVLLFRDDKGAPVHSAVIQSVDLAAGLVRYLQSTDEAPEAERGVHESFIRFDPAKPETRLKDPALEWSQLRLSPFAGEKPSEFRDDGMRYRAFPEVGGGTVVRVKALAKALERLGRGVRP